MTDPAAIPGGRRSGSQKRRAADQIKVNCTAAQKAALVAKADELGLSAAALCLNVLLACPLPRQRRPRLDQKLLAHFLAAVARLGDGIRASIAEMGKSGSNLNQIAHHLNAGRPPERIMGMLEAALLKHQQVLELHEAILKDAIELRTLGMQAHGYERPEAKDDES